MGLGVSDRAASPLRVFGAMLRSYRVKAGMSLEQLGARVYLSDDTVGKIENGQRCRPSSSRRPATRCPN